MPAQRLHCDSIRVGCYDIAGRDSAEVSEFVRHIGLMPESLNSFAPGNTAALVHMGPPLEMEPEDGAVHVVGTIPLTSDEVQQIRLEFDRLHSEYEAAKVSAAFQYAIRPHIEPVRAADNTVIRLKFSCAGFVIHAYSVVDIDLVLTDESLLPPVSIETLIDAYPDHRGRLENPAFRSYMNLPGDGPWPVVLPGYVFNALDRSEAEIRSGPYRPQDGDAYFPSRRNLRV